jgi:hypothetical protein
VYRYSDNRGVSWYSPITIDAGVSSPSPGPTPAIGSSMVYNDPLELMISYRTASNLRSAYSTDKCAWSIVDVAYTDAQSRDPNIGFQYNSGRGFRLVWANGTYVKIQNYNGTNWDPPVTVNNAIAGTIYSNYCPTHAFTQTFDQHIAWEGIRSIWREIIHNKNLNPSVFTEFRSSYNHYTSPSITGHDGGRASLLWQWNAANSPIYRTTYSGTSWSTPASVGNGVGPSTSIENPPGGTSWGVWTDITGSAWPPYQLVIGPSGGPMQKTAVANETDGDIESWSNSRRIVVFEPNSEEGLSFEIKEPVLVLGDGSIRVLRFTHVVDTLLYTPATAWNAAETAPIAAAGNVAARIKFDIESRIASGARYVSFGLPLMLELVNTRNGRAVASSQVLPVAGDSVVELHHEVQLMSNLLVETEVMFRVRPSVVKEQDAHQAAVLEVFSSQQGESLARGATLPGTANDAPSGFKLHPCCPNPFNPSTEIRFDLPGSYHVQVVVYDILGRGLAILIDGTYSAGAYSVVWNPRSANVSIGATGVYFARMQVTDELGRIAFSETTKMMFLK